VGYFGNIHGGAADEDSYKSGKYRRFGAKIYDAQFSFSDNAFCSQLVESY
jgi:hypothetical protein